MKHKLIILSIFLLFAGCGFSPGPEPVWEFKTGYPVWADPVISGKKVYIGSDRFYCLNAETGKPIWTFETFGVVKSPALPVDDRVYLQCGGLYCFEAETGKLVWEFWTEYWEDRMPVIAHGKVYAIIGDKLYCILADSGKKLWSVKSYGGSVPVAADGRIYIGGYGEIFCFDAETGSRLWSAAGTGLLHPAAAGGRLWRGKSYTMLRPVAAGGRIYVDTTDNNVYCLGGLTGNILWSSDIGVPKASGITLSAGSAYIIANKLKCLDALTGSLKWETAISSPVINRAQTSGKYVYVKSFNGMFTSIEATTGKIIQEQKLWNFKPAWGNFALKDDHVYVGSHDYWVRCFKVNQ